MAAEYRFQTAVDDGLLANATEELFNCLWAQNRAYIRRFHDSARVSRAKSLLRFAGLAISLFGVVLCIVVWWRAPSWCPAWLEAKAFLPLFVAAFLVFYGMPVWDRTIRKWTESSARKQCRRRARNSMAPLRKLAPLTVEYRIAGDKVTCFHGVGGSRKPAWAKRLKGVAYRGGLTTVVFARPGSLAPCLIILHRDTSALSSVLEALSVQSRPIGRP